MRPTSIGFLVWVALAAVPGGWLLGRVVETWTNRLPPVPTVLPALLLFCVILLVVAERIARGWIAERRFDRRMNALRMARMVALAKASSLFGALAVGAYTGIAVLAFDSLATPAGQDRLLWSGVVVAVSVAMTVVGLRLERACQVPPEDGPDDPTGTAGAGEGAAP